jgi:hypothetical protein
MASKIALIGWGTANMLFAAHLVKQQGVDPRRLVIIDPYHDGGALLRSWAHVRSNTTFRQFKDALASIGCPEAGQSGQPADEPTPLHIIAHALIGVVRPLVERAERIFGTASQIRYIDSKWQITVQTADGPRNLQAAICSLAPGAQPKILQTGCPQIPLQAALHLPSLQTYTAPGSHIVIFGSAHSATLIAKAAADAGCRVTIVHLGQPAFLFASEGAYDGVKQDAEHIARAVLADGLEGKVQLVDYQDGLALHRTLLTADYTICACGFDVAGVPQVIVENNTINTVKGLPYNPATGEIAPRLFGWGIAFPSTTTVNGRTYVDVSIPSFTAHILAQKDRLHALLNE